MITAARRSGSRGVMGSAHTSSPPASVTEASKGDVARSQSAGRIILNLGEQVNAGRRRSARGRSVVSLAQSWSHSRSWSFLAPGERCRQGYAFYNRIDWRCNTKMARALNGAGRRLSLMRHVHASQGAGQRSGTSQRNASSSDVPRAPPAPPAPGPGPPRRAQPRRPPSWRGRHHSASRRRADRRRGSRRVSSSGPGRPAAASRSQARESRCRRRTTDAGGDPGPWRPRRPSAPARVRSP